MRGRIILNHFCSLFLLSFLTACGGGGGGGSTAPSSSSAALTFSPSSITETYFEGDSIAISIMATVNIAPSGNVYAYIIDNTGIVSTNATVAMGPGGGYIATINTSPILPVGHYQGVFQVKLCPDAACKSQYQGSPSLLPFDITVAASSNLTTLSQWPGVNNWETFQGNAAHTGYVPVTLDEKKFSSRWHINEPNDATITPVVVANGLVYMAIAISPSKTIIAFREADGSIAWQRWIGNGGMTSPPAVSNGKVFLSSIDWQSNLISYDAVSGDQIFKTSLPYQVFEFPPTVTADAVYDNPGMFGRIYNVDSVTGLENWLSDLSPSSNYDTWAPAIDDNYVYACITNIGLDVLDKSTGLVSYNIPPQSVSQQSTVSQHNSLAPVIGENKSVYCIDDDVQASSGAPAHNTLTRYDTTAREVSWSLQGSYQINPVVANGVVYVANVSPYQLEARSATNGALLWKWTPPRADETDYFGNNLIVTDNMIFVSTNKQLYAISLTSHAPVWTYWKPGRIAISQNGVLYISTYNWLLQTNQNNIGLSAVNLK